MSDTSPKIRRAMELCAKEARELSAKLVAYADALENEENWPPDVEYCNGEVLAGIKTLNAAVVYLHAAWDE